MKRPRMSRWALLLVGTSLPFLYNSCGQPMHMVNQSALSSSSTADGTPPDISQQVKYQCTDATTRGLSETVLRRLTQSEYVNTYTDLFGADVVAAAAGSISGLPLDVIQDSVGEFNPMHSADHVQALLYIAIDLGSRVAANDTYLSRVAPTCVIQGVAANSIADSCITTFVTNLGLKIHRRPLSSTQAQNYLAFYKDPTLSSSAIRDRVGILIARMLQAPEFQYLWSVAPTPAGSGQRAKVDGYTVASRLAYRLTGSMTDATLLSAAANLTDVDSIRAQAQRLIATPRGHQQVRALFNHWLRLYKVPTPSGVAALNLGVSSSDAALTQLRGDAVNEILDYAEYIVFNKNGTFQDLMSSNVAFAKTADMAKILATAVDTQNPVFTSNGQNGLLLQPALLFSSTDRDSPIKRGVSIRTRVLCDEVPPPPASLDTQISTISNSFDHDLYSSRDVAQMMTGSGSCVTCHSRLNSIGYALSYFGPFGNYRTADMSFNTDGSVKKSFAVNAVATNLDVISAGDSAADHRDLVNLVSNSEKARACLAVYAFRASRLRLEAGSDNCQLNDIEASLDAGTTVQQALVINGSSEDILWKGF